jgi:hypothetical protein
MSIRSKQSLKGTIASKARQSLTGKLAISTIGTPGKDGISPTVSIQATTEGYRISIVDGEGEHVFEIMHGKDGRDGVINHDEVKQIVDDYMEENPLIPHFTINGEGPDENGNFTILSNIDYDSVLAFDTSELVINTSNTTSVLDQAILGQTVLA